jgi:hypothetical protein
MAPHSIVVRLTDRLVGGFDMYAFRSDGSWSELARLKADDLPPREFWLGGAVVRQMDEKKRADLAAAGVHLHENAQSLLAQVSDSTLGG